MKKLSELFLNFLVCNFFILFPCSSFSQILGTNYALVVGISTYPNIPQLLYADDDAELFADYLKVEGICYRKNISLLVDSAATTANFYRELNKIRNKIKPNDKVFIYFAGHGDVETDLESGFLLTYNCEKNNYAATSIDIAMLERYVNSFINKQANVILITDACRSGNLAGGLAGAKITLSSLTKGFNSSIKLLSCQPNQLSQEKSYFDGGHGVFTYHLIDALKGFADKNNDKLISLRELDLYLDSVSVETKQKQTPKVEGNPVSIISFYKDTIKSALITQKNKHQNEFIVSRDISMNENDSNLYYKKFVENIINRRLIGPNKNNAFNTIEDAVANKQNTELIQNMKNELVAIIEDEIQKNLNRYLRCDDRVDSYKTSTKYNFNLLDKCILLVDNENPRFDEIEAKRNFFYARNEFYNNDIKKFPLLITKLKKSTDILGRQAWITNLIGNLYFAIGNVDSSYYYYLKSMEYSPTWPYPVANLGWNYHLLGNETKALDYLIKALTFDSSNSWVLSAIGEVYWFQRNFKEAKIYYQQAYEIDSTDIHLLQLLGAFYGELGSYDSSSFYYIKAIEKDSSQKESWFGFAQAKFNKKEYDWAEFAYTNAIKIDSLFIESLIGLGNLKSLTFHPDLAINIYSKVLSLDPYHPDLWSKVINYNLPLDISLLNRGYCKVLIDLEKDSLNYFILMTRGIIESYLYKDNKKAEYYFQKALEIKPNDSVVWYNIACFFSMSKNVKKSLYYFEKALSLGYKDFNQIENDPDLLNIKKEKEFQVLIKRYKKK